MDKITYNTKIDNHIIEIEKEKNKKDCIIWYYYNNNINCIQLYFFNNKIYGGYITERQKNILYKKINKIIKEEKKEQCKKIIE